MTPKEAAMAKESIENICWRRMHVCRRDAVVVMVITLMVFSWSFSFFYQYLTITHPSPTSAPINIVTIQSYIKNSYSSTRNNYTNVWNIPPPSRNTQINNPKIHSQSKNTQVNTANVLPRTNNTRSNAIEAPTHTQNMKVESISISSGTKTTKTITAYEQFNDKVDDTNNSSHKSRIHNPPISTNTLHAYNTTSIATASTTLSQDQPGKSSDHAALPPLLTRSDSECEEMYQEEGRMRQVVLWTPFWHTWNGWKGMLRDHMRLKDGRCATWRCEFLLGKNLTLDQVKGADAVVFFSLDASLESLPPRSPQALWIWLELEAPPISQMAAKNWTALERMGVFFNLTMSYHHLNPVMALFGRLVSLSIPLHCPVSSDFNLDTSSPTHKSYYHHMHEFDVWQRKEGKAVDTKLKAERERRHGGLIRTAITDTSHPDLQPNDISEGKSNGREIPLMEYGEMTLTAEEIELASRPRVAAWMASHCPTKSRRESLIAALQRYMAITTVGKCGKASCGKNHMDIYCYKWLAASHLFYMSFENALCDDYHTEKLWRPLEYGMVPVVYGGPSYRNSLPFHSYIDVSNFSSPAALANHLVYLATHPSAYLRYLQWRRYWRVQWPVHWCGLCEVLYSKATTTRTTMKHWWNTTTTCYDPLPW